MLIMWMKRGHFLEESMNQKLSDAPFVAKNKIYTLFIICENYVTL